MCIGLGSIPVLAVNIPIVSADEEISLSLSRQFGSSFGGKISGKFKLTARSDVELANITLLFNNTQVAFAEADVISYSFNTKEFGIGIMNMTAIGMTASGEQFQETLIRTFMDPVTSNILAISITVLALGAVILKYYARSQKSKKNGKNSRSTSGMDVSIDKKF